MDSKTRYITDTRQHYFLFGPRGTGKSTWLRKHYGEAIWIDLLDPAQFRSYEARPERLRDVVPVDGQAVVVVIYPHKNSFLDRQLALRGHTRR